MKYCPLLGSDGFFGTCSLQKDVWTKIITTAWKKNDPLLTSSTCVRKWPWPVLDTLKKVVFFFAY
jgi:hypothetical protein